MILHLGLVEPDINYIYFWLGIGYFISIKYLILSNHDPPN